MVDSNLTSNRITAGETLVRKLDASGLSPDAAFWLYDSELGSWKLVIAEMKVREEGSKRIYKQIQKHLGELGKSGAERLNLDDIYLLPREAPIVALIRSAIRTGPGISGIRFTKNVVNGRLIDDAYIYRST
jgi:hypothetical protein